MTSGQPPQPPYGGQQPEYGQQQPPPGDPPSYGQQPPPEQQPAGQQPPGQQPTGPPPGQPQYGQPPPGQPQYGQPPPGPPPYGQPPPGQLPYGQPPYGQPQQQPYGQQPGYGPPPGHGQPQYGQTPYGQPPYGQPPYGQPPYEGSPASVPPGGTGGLSFDLDELRLADYVIAGGAVLFFVFALFPWWSFGNDLFGFSLSGFDNGTVSTAFLCFLLAAVWTLLPAFFDLRLGFPRAWVTVGLAGLGFVLTLFAWIESMGVSFQVWPLLGMLTASAILLFAILSLIPQLRNRAAVPAGLSGAVQWANRPAPGGGEPGQPYGRLGREEQQPYGQHGPPGAGPSGYGQSAATSPLPPTPPPPPGGTGHAPGAPRRHQPADGSAGGGSASGGAAAGGPAAPGGATASGEGPPSPDRPAGG